MLAAGVAAEGVGSTASAGVPTRAVGVPTPAAADGVGAASTDAATGVGADDGGGVDDGVAVVSVRVVGAGPDRVGVGVVRVGVGVPVGVAGVVGGVVATRVGGAAGKARCRGVGDWRAAAAGGGRCSGGRTAGVSTAAPVATTSRPPVSMMGTLLTPVANAPPPAVAAGVSAWAIRATHAPDSKAVTAAKVFLTT